MNAAEKLLPEFDEEFASTRKFLALVPDDKLAWKPHAKSMELGRLAWHLADFPEWCSTTLKKDAVKFTEQDAEKARHAWEGKKRADLLSRFDRELPEARSAWPKLAMPTWRIIGRWSGPARRSSTARASRCCANGC